jgi:formate--tetrahydrofolate ligase
MGWIMDFCAQSLRNMVIGLGGKMDGYLMQSRFDIAVSSEVMAILAIVKDLKDLRERLGKITVAYDRSGKPVTCEDLECAGAMTALMRESINPTLLQTVEGQPVFVHAGPFANIAVGQSSIIADRIALKLFDYDVTESGFAADIGFEKFWNVKCRESGLKPNVSVLTTTIRALKMHGGGPRVAPGLPLPEEYKKENLGLLEKGAANMVHHLKTIKQSGMKPVVCINWFHTDTKDEIALLRRLAEAEGARVAVSTHWLNGGDGALELADAVIDACEEKSEFKFLYPLDMPLRQRVEAVAKNVYGADGVSWAPDAEAKAKAFEADPEKKDYYTMMVKTHLSLTYDPNLKGVPKGWVLPVRDVLIFSGAKFLCPVTGAISLMPGTSSDPAYRRVDVDVKTGKVTGLF